MKNKITLFWFIIIFNFATLTVVAQNSNKIDPYLVYLKNTLIKNEVIDGKVPIAFSESLSNLFNISKGSTNQNIKVIINLKDNDISQIKNLPSVKVNSILDKIITAELPIDKLEELSGVENIISITLGKPIEYFLDAADLLVRGTEGRNTFNLNGTGVIIGIMDTGIDFENEDFKNQDGTTRIKYLWDQKDAVGPNPTGYSYGTEWNSTQINSGTCRQIDTVGHGTLVSGIAAGNGRATGNGQPANTYVGMAPNADLIVVQLDFSNFANIIDGILWLDSKAKALNKPWVVNLSVGSKWGPRDGTSPFDQAIFGVQNLPNSAKGRIIVSAVGNFGYNLNDPNRQEENKLHASSESSPTTKTFRINSSNDNNNENFWMEIWYPENSNYSIRLKAPNGTWYGPYQKGQGNTDPGYGLITTNGVIGIHNEHFVNNYYANTPSNLIEIHIWETNQTSGIRNGDWQIEMTAINNTGRWDSYITYNQIVDKSYFLDNSYDNTRIIAEPSTANQVIAVGSYNSKNSWINEAGQTISNEGYPLNQISYFSSPGPSRDGREKPDIYAPGAWVASSISGNSLLITD